MMEKKTSVSPRTFTWRYYINYIVVAALAILLTVLTLAGALPQSMLFLLEKITMNIVLAISLSLVVGFLGELSLGHAGFMCIGAYFGGFMSVVINTYTGINGKGVLSFAISLVVGAAVSGLFGFVIGLPALRLKGDYLAIVTLAFGEIVKTVFENVNITLGGKGVVEGPMGMRTPRLDKQYLFIIGFVLVLLTMAVVQNLIRSKHGRAITAIRDNEIAAKATGINVTKYKLVGFIVSAIFAGAAGVLYSFGNSTVSASIFDYNYSIEILVMVVLGGMASVNGVMISAVLITFINIQLQSVLTGDLAVLKDIIYSLILILLIIYNNAPGLKGIREKYNVKRLADIVRAKIFKKTNHYTDDDDAWERIPTKIDMDEILSVDLKVVESVQKADKEEKD